MINDCRASSATCTTEAFASLTLNNIKIISLNVTAARNYSTSGGGSFGGGSDGTGGVGVISASTGQGGSTVDICLIEMEYTHPGQNDNHRFLMDGGGGWLAGGESEVLSPVASGYTSSSTDGGHNSSAEAADWGLTRKQATEIYFGAKPKYSYWNGCSTGGRQAHVMAQRFPEQFDGIVGGSPAINWDKFEPATFWPDFMARFLGKFLQSLLVYLSNAIFLVNVAPPSCVLNAFTDAAISACDLLDGVKDNIISYPGQCHFKASSLVGRTISCKDPVGEIKVTPKMAELVTALWEGPNSVEGQFEWYGLHYDADLTGTLTTTCTSVSNCTVKVFLARNSSLDVDNLTHEDFDRFFRESVDQYSSIIGTENPDLTNMKRAGTKMIAWHGMQVPLIPTNGTVDYYTRAMEVDSHVNDYYRFFLAPGVTHCGGGDGFDPSDFVFDTLTAWVENGTVPNRLEATATAVKPHNTSTTRAGYLCPYPKVFTFNGENPNKESFFKCV
ncbi:Tannase/feruloyl esterase [Aspergillus heterothallicus]